MSNEYIKCDTDVIKTLQQKGIKNYGAIMLFCKILSLSVTGKCTASNAYFADVMGTTDRNIRKYISILKEKNVIKVYEDKKGSHTSARFIYPQQCNPGTIVPPSDTNPGTVVPGLPPNPGTFGSRPRNNQVMTPEHLGHDPGTIVPPNNRYIREYIREREERSVANAPSVLADARPAADAAKSKQITEYDFDFDGLLTNHSMFEIIYKTYVDYVMKGSYKDSEIKTMLLDTFYDDSGFYQCKNLNELQRCIDNLVD